MPALDVHLRYAGWSYQDLGQRSACRTTGDGQVLVFPAFRCRIRVVEGRAEKSGQNWPADAPGIEGIAWRVRDSCVRPGFALPRAGGNPRDIRDISPTDHVISSLGAARVCQSASDPGSHGRFCGYVDHSSTWHGRI